MTPAADGAATPARPALVIGAIGIVYGDIGTSPIYALREALRATSDGPPAAGEVIGLLSLIVWSLTLIVTLKYVAVVLRADNRGEGGSLSLMTLARRAATRPGSRALIGTIGMVGACLFIGDAVITPAISVLSAVEGLHVAAPAFGRHVVGITVAILVTLFAVQRFGTGRVSIVFGPVTVLWLLAIAAAGAPYIPRHPEVLLALNPLEAVRFLVAHAAVALLIAGAVFLAVTGAEALYADLGHFGRRPITVAWFALVLPCLLLSYFGQGAYVLEHGFDGQAILFDMVPPWASLAMVLLATAATVIASQAVISGTFSLLAQAIQLHFLPRQAVRHTSERQAGQIYLPLANVVLMLAVIALVLLFGSSERLAAAYGIAVTGDMMMTSLMLGFVIWRVWGRPAWQALLLVAPLLAIEAGFFAANSVKILDGGWVSLAISGTVLVIMLTWVRGSRLIARRARAETVPLSGFIDSLGEHSPPTVSGLAVYLTEHPDSVPPALLHSLKHFKVIHERVLLLTVETRQRPRVAAGERVVLERLDGRFARMTLRYGYAERPDVAESLGEVDDADFRFDPMTTTFVLSRRALRRAPEGSLPRWQEGLFALLVRNASDATQYFRIPTGRVVELGTQTQI